MSIGGGLDDSWVDIGGSDLEAFCIDQGVPAMTASDEFMGASASITITRVIGEQKETAALNDVLGKQGWVRILGTGQANHVRVIPVGDAAANARFAIHVPKGTTAFLAGGIRDRAGWDGSAKGAARGVLEAERIYAPHAAVLQQVGDFSRKLRVQFGKDSAIVKLFDSADGVSPRTKINWRLASATPDAAEQIVREEMANYRLELLTAKGVDSAQAKQVFGLSPAGTSVAVSPEAIDAYVGAYKELSSVVLGTHFRQLVARGLSQSGDLGTAAASARAQMAEDPNCLAYAEKLRSVSPFAGVARAMEMRSLAALEFSGDLTQALRVAGLAPNSRRLSSQQR